MPRSPPAPPRLGEDPRGRSLDCGRSLDGDPEESEGKWLLWRDVMSDHAHLEAWLHLAERAVACSGPAHFSYVGAKETLRRVERLRREAGPRLARADALARRNRTLARLFGGAAGARLLDRARSCGRRCEEAAAALESAAARLKHFVAEWEEFEEEREELALWLADLEVRLSEVDHMTGNSCEKLQQLQWFQQCVCVNAARLDDLLRRGEALIRRCGAADARHVEQELSELRRCSGGVFDDIARTHTRLLSLRLVFEDDHFLSPGPDSGCPSESLLDEEAGLDRPAWPRPPGDPPPPLGPAPDDPVLEWDPSVDVGHSVRHDASSCFSAGVKRRSYLSSLSDISGQDPDVERRLRGWLDHAHSGAAPAEARWATSTPDKRAAGPASFDGGRVRAWLGVQSPAPPAEETSCSRAAQTEESGERPEEDGAERRSACERASGGGVSSSWVPPLLFLLLLFLAALLLAALCWRHRGAAAPSGLHLTLTYVNGPPPT